MTREWFSVKELAGLPGMPGTERAVQLRAKADAWPSRRRPGRGGGREYPLSALPEITRMALAVERTKAIAINDSFNKGIAKHVPAVAVPARSEFPARGGIQSSASDLTPNPTRKISLPTVSNPSAWALKIALARADLVRAFVAEREAARSISHSATTAAHEFLTAYNAGLILPAIRTALGGISLSTLYAYEKTFRSAGYDYLALLPEWGQARRGACSVTEEEKNTLLTVCLHQNKYKIGSAITLTKHLLERRGIASATHPSTLRRYIETYQKNHYDRWILAREGEKALRDKVAPYLERDDGLLAVGDVLVGDGHRCNFTAINPFTGKPCRPSLIGFYDWASRVMVGWAIMLEENVQAIAAALRSAIITLGKIPRYLYLDNGKAFKSKIFNDAVNLEECGVYGMFVRLGIHTTFAWPYNARSKPIERFFGTLSNTFERLLPSFCGASIDDKPASLRRNEKFMQGLFPQRTPTIPEVNEWLKSWQGYYLQMDHPTRRDPDGVRPTRGQVFAAGRGPGVNPEELTYLMMSMEIRTLRQNGIHFLGRNYWNENLYGMKDRVVIKYDFSDLSRVAVYDRKGEGLGWAERVEPVHPMAAISETPGQDYAAIQHGIKQQRSLTNSTKKILKLSLAQGRKEAMDALPWNELVEAVPGLPEKLEKYEGELEEKTFGIQDSEFSDGEPEISVQEPEPDPDQEPPFERCYERYEWLMERPGLTAEQRAWMEEYRSGRLEPGEYELIFGRQKKQAQAIYD